jgi:hypothetical protein
VAMVSEGRPSLRRSGLCRLDRLLSAFAVNRAQDVPSRCWCLLSGPASPAVAGRPNLETQSALPVLNGYAAEMASDDGWHGLEDDTDDHLRIATEQLAMWARQTERDAEAYQGASDELSVADKMWEKDLGEYMRERDYQQAWRAAFEKTWVAGFRLISSAFQMEKWHAVHRKARGVEHQENKALKTLRNVLEHLDEAAFVEASYAQRDPNGRKNQSIDSLPKGTLFLGWSGAHREWVFGLILVLKLKGRASQLTWYDQTREDLEWEPSDIDYENMGYYDDITRD